MIKKIFGTFGTKALQSVIGFMTLWLGAQFLGDEAWGICGTVLLDVSLLLIGTEFLSGSGLIFFTPRKSFSTLLKISYGWTAFVGVLYASVILLMMSYFPETLHKFIPIGYETLVLTLVMVYSLHNFNMNILLGKERVGAQNVLYIIQFMTQFLSMLAYIFIFDLRDERAFIYSLLTGYSVACLSGFTQIWQYINDKGKEPIRSTVKEMFRFGAIIQLSTLVSTLNKRLSFWIIKSFGGDAKVGVYNSSTQVSEAPKLIGQSIALVQFSKISNLSDKGEAAKLTMQLLKVGVLLTTACILVLCLLPTDLYSFIFTESFAEMKVVIIALAPGIIFLTANTIFCHFFSGIDMPKHNLYGATVGLAVTIPSLYILIPLYGMVGAGISASLTHFATIIYQWIVFKRVTGVSSKELAISKEDVAVFKDIIISFKDKLSRKG